MTSGLPMRFWKAVACTVGLFVLAVVWRYEFWLIIFFTFPRTLKGAIPWRRQPK